MSHVVLKDYPHHLTKYEDKRTKISSFKLLLIGENLEVQTRLFKKISIFHLFYELQKTWKYTVHSPRSTFQNPNFESTFELQKVMS